MTWRLIKTPPAHGAWNMAVDEAILEAIGQNHVPTTLRLYAWQPACLSLGFAQPYRDADPHNLAAQGWQLVRRPTGGRAILHTDELTYAVIGGYQEPLLAGGVLQSYRRLSEALLEALRLMGLPAQALPKREPAEATRKEPEPVCFEVPSNYEITIDGKKLIGSAQARKKEGVLQHGSLPLSGDLARITQALWFENEAHRAQAAQRLLQRATTVEHALGHTIDWEQASQAFEQAFRRLLDNQLETGGLTPAELARAAELVEQKYAHPDWTQRDG